MGSISSAAALVVADAVDDSVARWKRASPSFAADNTGGVAMLRPFVEGREHLLFFDSSPADTTCPVSRDSFREQTESGRTAQNKRFK